VWWLAGHLLLHLSSYLLLPNTHTLLFFLPSSLYQNVGTSAIIYGVGSNNLHLPIPSSCPQGLKVLLEMCWWVN